VKIFQNHSRRSKTAYTLIQRAARGFGASNGPESCAEIPAFKRLGEDGGDQGGREEAIVYLISDEAADETVQDGLDDGAEE
jgi:hypothetical protein